VLGSPRSTSITPSLPSPGGGGSARGKGALAFSLLLLLLLAACDQTSPATAEVSWRFIDGRRCDDAGAQHVEIRGAGPSPVRVHCEDGFPPSAHTLELAEAPAELTFEALTLSGAPLYRGRALVPGEGGPVLVTLRFVGGDQD